MPNAAYTMPTAVTIRQIYQDNYRTRTLVLDARLAATPGQFVMVWLPRFDEKPFSLVDSDPVTLMVTAVGPFSELIHERQPGDRIWIRGPYGRGYQVAPDQTDLLLVGGGYGVAPLLWLARQQTGRRAQITSVIGARTARDILYADQFRRLATLRAADAEAAMGTRHSLLLTTEDGSLGIRGRVTDALGPLLPAGARSPALGLYACGPHGMLEALEQMGLAHGIPCQLSWEAYMRCAIGICGACEHKGKVLCLDGPVLTSAALV